MKRVIEWLRRNMFMVFMVWIIVDALWLDGTEGWHTEGGWWTAVLIVIPFALFGTFWLLIRRSVFRNEPQIAMIRESNPLHKDLQEARERYPIVIWVDPLGGLKVMKDSTGATRMGASVYGTLFKHEEARDEQANPGE